MSHNASPPDQFSHSHHCGVQSGRGLASPKSVRKEGSLPGDRFGWQSPQAPEGHVSEVFGFLDSPTFQLWAGGASVS